ncbi:hypothetical protein BCR43DRAFT_495086 [Syncephalastrum racemosum]|uniref:Uncharacterized protein n=1 Tax=Syncephalastrum racemosum TaxID=13706 RepID=A0A1X2H925_SYNRA|nr:hypothetical protein BCR43DRAFT_495086 [Syncephalastrum racemosum]
MTRVISIKYIKLYKAKTPEHHNDGPVQCVYLNRRHEKNMIYDYSIILFSYHYLRPSSRAKI